MATKQDLKELEINLKTDIGNLEYRLIIKISAIVGTMITLAIAVTTAIAKLHLG